jgi:hypothetical protein
MSSTGRAFFPVGRVIVGSSSSGVALAAGKACLSDMILDGKHKYHLDGRLKTCGRSRCISSLDYFNSQLVISNSTIMSIEDTILMSPKAKFCNIKLLHFRYLMFSLGLYGPTMTMSKPHSGNATLRLRSKGYIQHRLS